METNDLMVEDVPLPDYIDPDQRSRVGRSNDRAYELRRRSLQRELGTDLSKALHGLFQQQMDVGFIQDDLSQVKYFQCYELNGRSSFFIGQFNPRRSDRSAGAGRKVAPRGSQTRAAPDASCFLCPDNVRWQQRGVQLFYQFNVNGRPYNALCNPFPFGPVHITIASSDHVPQSWRESQPDKPEIRIRAIVEDLYDIAVQVPSFVGFYNGVGAGATIEKHFHYHFFEVPEGQKAFPLQQAATRTAAEIRHPTSGAQKSVPRLKVKDDYYPLTAFRLLGARREVVENAVNLVCDWDRLSGDYASANIIAISEGDAVAGDAVAVYLVPRNRFYSRSPGMTGIVGGLETLGEFVFYTDAEDQAINEQRIDYNYMWRILEAVKPPNAQRLDLGRDRS